MDKRGLAAPVGKSVFARRILGEVLVVVGVVERLDRIRLRQVAGIGLTVTRSSVPATTLKWLSSWTMVPARNRSR